MKCAVLESIYSKNRMANNKCKECGCVCNKCASNHDVHLHVEIENLKQRLLEREHHINTMETTFLNEANKYPNGEFFALREELLTWQDKYSRLYDAHKRVQKVNQSLEDKLLKLVDKTETEKSTLTKDVATLSHRLADANYTIQRLQADNEKLKNDVNLAIQLLQCKPTNFVSHRVDSLPNEVQAKVSSYVASRRKPVEDKKPIPEVRSIKVPIPTFPPTAMVYSIPKNPSPEKDSNSTNDAERPQVDVVSAAIMAKILEERERERSYTKHCDSCTCSKNILPALINNLTHHSVATQTGNKKTALCLKCNEDLERSPLGGMKLVRSADSLLVPNNNSFDNSIKTYPQNVAYYDINEKDSNKNNLANSNKIVVSENSKVFATSFSDSYSKSTQKPAFDPKSGHHRLCDQNINAVPNMREQEKQKKTNLKNNDNLKGPRYCSMVQSGSKNILLDNVDNNYAPVIYTRQGSTEKKHKKEIPEKNVNVHVYESSHTGSISSEDKNSKSLTLSEGDSSLTTKQQRVAEWVQNLDENEASSSENSKAEQNKRLTEEQIDNLKDRSFKGDLLIKSKISETEQKSIRKLSNGKQKYKFLPQSDTSIIEVNKNKNGNSHTETEI